MNQQARNKITSYFLVTARCVSSSLILSTLKIKAIRFSETSVPTIATHRHIPVDGIIRSHRRENLRSDLKDYISLLS
jgi:hypothetical protein